MKRRLAQRLLEERTRRGGGDPRRFPQPQMAQLLNVSLRQYQRWEDPADPSLPYWRNIDQMADVLELDTSDLIGDDDAYPAPTPNGTPPPAPEDVKRMMEEVAALRADFAQLRKDLRGLLPETRPAPPTLERERDRRRQSGR